MHTLREELLVGTKSLKEIVLKVDLHDISSFGTNVSELISGINDTAGENTLDLVGKNVGIFNLLLNEVKIPST